VVHGSDNKNFELIREHPSAPVILHDEDALGYAAGRVIGAKASQSDILLFLEGHIPIPAPKLLPFIQSIEKGADVALNNISPFIPDFHQRDPVSIMKEFVNEVMGRPDLMTNSMTNAPHALSRNAVENIGLVNLAKPPLAQAIAMHMHLKVTAPTSINFEQLRHHSSINHEQQSPAIQHMIGDHLEALSNIMSHRGTRLCFEDKLRRRHMA
ncbi:glycosyltransferase, partial [Paenibacillus sp. LMG 31458]|nr:glycosyltransferase [Paenibacillus phytorum]